MSADATAVQKTVTDFLAELGKLDDDFGASTPLYADGAGLDSLETAELSAILEDTYGSDPYSEGQLPQTLDELLAFYVSG